MTKGSEAPDDITALARGGRTNIIGFMLRLLARLPFLFIAGRIYGPDIVGRFAIAVLAVEFAALIATLGLKRGLAQAFRTSDQADVCVAWDGLAVAGIASLLAAAVLAAFPVLMFPNSPINPLDQLLPFAVLALTWTEVMLAALAYKHNVRASVTARAVVEPWTISIAAYVVSFWSLRDGLIIAYAMSTVAALIAAAIPFLRTYGLPTGWSPRVAPLFALARDNAPLAGADAIEWATRNLDRAVLSLFFAPSVVGIYYMAQQVASIPQKLKSSFDPILGPVLTKSIADDDRPAVARAVRQVGFWIVAAQAGLALMGAIPAEGVMGVVGPQFVAGATALVFLLLAEVIAVPGSVSESALVYMARKRNLAISVTVLLVQIGLTFALLALAEQMRLPTEAQTAAPALALALALGMGSVVKAMFLRSLLGAPVSPFRWTLLLAVAVAAGLGSLATRWVEWAELAIGVPLIAVSYLLVLFRFSFKSEDRALFRRKPLNAGSAASR
ncbi:MAG: lipopolysaccharide biosynthesis protein [Sphingomonadaceae bacterium]